MKTKIQQLEAYLKRHGSITKMIAARKFNIFGLKEQINRLIRRGMKIKTVLMPNGDNSPYACYTVVK